MSKVTIDHYGKHVFRGDIAAPYLTKQGLAANALENFSWTTDGSADKVRRNYISVRILVIF